MIVRCWGEVNGFGIDFHPIDDRPGYWTGIAPRVDGLQHIKIWAENDKGARGQIELGVYVYPYRETYVRLVLSPFKVQFTSLYETMMRNPLKVSLNRLWKVEEADMAEQCTFHFGEGKKVQINVANILNPDDVFKVTDAKWELKHGDEVESSGDCETIPFNDNSVSVVALIRPMIPDTIYDLVYTYTIEPENFIHTVKVRVVK